MDLAGRTVGSNAMTEWNEDLPLETTRSDSWYGHTKTLQWWCDQHTISLTMRICSCASQSLEEGEEGIPLEITGYDVDGHTENFTKWWCDQHTIS